MCNRFNGFARQFSQWIPFRVEDVFQGIDTFFFKLETNFLPDLFGGENIGVQYGTLLNFISFRAFLLQVTKTIFVLACQGV
jgi:hypothetical protein